MKFLKYLFSIIIALLVVFLAFGLIKPTVHYGHEITVNKSIQEAWAVQQDESKFGQWLEGFKSIDLISGKQGAIGSKYKIIVNPGDGQSDFEMTETLLSLKEFDHVSLSMDSDFMVFDQTTSFKEANGKVTIKTDSQVKAKSFVMRSMFSMMETLGGTFQKQEEKNIEALKKVIEGNTTNYYPAAAEPPSQILEQE